MGHLESALSPEFGPVNFRTNFITQQQRLWVADPKAVQHILHSCHLYDKPSISKEMIAVLLAGFVGVLEGKSFRAPRNMILKSELRGRTQTKEKSFVPRIWL
jgi:hypothetical protein